MLTITEQPVFHFTLYPPTGGCDWRYTFATAMVRALEDKLFNQQFLTDLANARDIKELAEMLAASDYSFVSSASQSDIEKILSQRRTETMLLFEQLIDNPAIVQLFRSRADFANLRLAIRRFVQKKNIGKDYCTDGNVPPEVLEQIFETEIGNLPAYFKKAIEAGLTGYYRGKNIQDIDIEIDRCESDYQLTTAAEVGSVFLTELFRMQIDLTNIRTLMRMKFNQIYNPDVFLNGGYIERSKLAQCFDIEYDALTQHFYATPYYHLIELAVSYLQGENSFLKLEALCEQHLLGFLKMTRYISAGPQPVIAYLLIKEQEIRMIRMIIACKKAEIEPKLIIDRIAI